VEEKNALKIALLLKNGTCWTQDQLMLAIRIDSPFHKFGQGG